MSFNDDKKTEFQKAWEEKVRAIRKKKAFAKRLRQEYKDYIREAEHQDGTEYWDNFNTEEEFLNDFGLYLTSLYGDTEHGPYPIPE